jgi:uridylate kinase
MKGAMVFSLGGSLIYPKEIDVDYLKKFRKLILDGVSAGKRFGIVCGGGSICRYYMEKGKEIRTLENEEVDRIGIGVTRANAWFVRELFGSIAHEEVIIDYSKDLQTDKSIVIGAGWKPGCSTDKDAVLLAEKYNADTVVNLTNVDYVYDKDPRKFDDAKPFEKMTWSDFKGIVGGKWKAGMNLPFDPVAAQLAEELSMKVVIINGNEIANLKKFLSGEAFKGTVIQ